MKMEALSALQERGLAIAATGKLVRDGDTWLVPSQTGRGRYARRHAMLVPGLRTARAAVQAHLCGGVCGGREKPDGTVTDTRAVRVTYRQDWPAHNKAQTTEKETFCKLRSFRN